MIDVNCMIEGFDEAIYLQSNKDVYEAVKKGHFVSGWQHFALFGFCENRPGVSTEVKKVILDDAGCHFLEPLPPNKLRKRVHGNENLAGFERTGKILSENIHDVLKTVLNAENNSRILDFGCGCGRVIKYLHNRNSNNRFYGTDIDNEAIDWCKSHMSVIGEFFTNEAFPPLPFENEFFDFVYSVSVFTHLPEDMQFAWLDELKRITKKGGYLILTTHGEELLYTEAKEAKKQLREKGFYYSVGTGTDGLPDFYQTSFHTENYIHRQWSKFFEIKQIIKKGIADHQDLVFCMKRNN